MRHRLKPRPGEVRQKEWLLAVGAKLGISVSCAWSRMARGGFPGVKVRRINSRVAFVDGRKALITSQPTGVPFKVWLMNKGDELGIKYNSVWTRIKRGQLAAPELVRINKRVIFVTGCNEKE